MRLSSRSASALAILIILIAVTLAYASSWNDVLIVDEDPHVGAGYSYVARLDMRLNPEHPPLAKALAGLALLPLRLNEDAFLFPPWTSDVNGQWDFGRKLIWNSGNNADLITHAVKIPPLILFALTAWLIYWWASKRYGLWAGLIALVLFAFSPTVMAHARYVTTDIPAALGVLLATYYFLVWLEAPTKKHLWFAAIAFGVAMLMKFSTILLMPFFLLVALIFSWQKIGKTVLLMTLGFLVVVWPTYTLLNWNSSPVRQRHDTEAILRTFGNRLLADPVVWASDKPLIRHAAQYGLGLLMVTQRSAGGNTVYYRGEVSIAAGPSYFPFVYFVKEPLAWWGLVIIASMAIITKIKVKKLKIRDWTQKYMVEIALVLWLGIYWFTSVRSNLNIGVRHLLPVFPFTIILVAGMLSKIQLKVGRNLVYILVIWFMLENIFVFPHYLSYFNQTVGGSSGGHRYVVDSNLDWGQDLKRLGTWMDKNAINHVYLDYFGWADQFYYLGNRFTWVTKESPMPKSGYFAVSATYLMNNIHDRYAWLANKSPEAVIGNSIFVYNISDR